MIVDLRLDGPAARGTKESAEATGAALRAVQAGSLDPTSTRVVGDWIQYKHNFRAPVARRRVIGREGRALELAFDLRRMDPAQLDAEIEEALGDLDGQHFSYLEDWVPASKSIIWRFNALYWGELALWQEASGREYAQALPGGESAATKADGARAVILELFRIFDTLAERHALPERLDVLEIGVGNGEQAKVWLDEFLRLDDEQGRGYYRRLQYLMGDYSSHVLELARATVVEHRSHVSSLVLDASRPRETLRFLEGGVFFVYISNVYDNLASDELAVLADELYQVEVRAYLPEREVEEIAASFGIERTFVQGFAGRLVALGPRLLAETLAATFSDVSRATAFWQRVWEALRLDERYRPLGPLDRYEICEGLNGELLGPIVAGQGDVRFHVSNGAVASFLDTLPLLHPYGLLSCHDLFVTDFAQFRNGFRGPGKYDGSVVNWVNGPILRAAASRRGYQVTFQPFAHGSRSPISTAVARARD
jgi:hypothetical protein